jgi:hypothetical protein
VAIDFCFGSIPAVQLWLRDWPESAQSRHPDGSRRTTAIHPEPTYGVGTNLVVPLIVGGESSRSMPMKPAGWAYGGAAANFPGAVPYILKNKTAPVCHHGAASDRSTCSEQVYG